MLGRALTVASWITALVFLAGCGQDSQPATGGSSNSVSQEQQARQAYDQALAARRGRGDRGLTESMATFRRIIRAYPGTSAARDARRQLRASEELKQGLDEVRRDFRRALQRNR